MKNIAAILSATLLATCAAPGVGAAAADGTQVQPDNTRVNRDDRRNPLPTAQNQSPAKEDRELAAAVRKAITSDKSLSTYGHNVKVIVRDGSVTLRGPVRSAEEKMKLEQLARGAANGRVVSNNVMVKQVN